MTLDNWIIPKDFGRFFVGFDPFLKRLSEAAEQTVKLAQNYPPYNIKKIDDEHFVIEMAVAGFGKTDLDIELKEGTLTVSGSHDADEKDYIYQGIANRAFTRSFVLNDEVEVKDAEIFNGMLKIALERLIPEAKQPKKIAVKSKGEKQLLVD